VDAGRRRFVGSCLAAPILASDSTLSSGQHSDASTTWPSVFPALRQSIHGRPLTYLDSAAKVLGGVNPIKEICAQAHAAGARVVVDGAQGVPHVKIDVRDLGCDFYVFSGHKMLGPMATGVLWGRRELLDAMPPYHVGSNMAHAVELDRAEFEHGAQKFQAGTPDVAGPVLRPPFASSMKQGTKPGLDMIRHW
jgi:selenocysteine lyase/cysteine desulfurase